MKIFLGVSLGFFFFFFLFFVFFFFVLFFVCLFVFVPCGKSSVSSYDVLVVFFFFFKISRWDFFFIPGVHSRVRGQPMWCLKVFFFFFFFFLRRG